MGGRTLGYDEVRRNASALRVCPYRQGQRHVAKRLHMPPTKGYECGATSVEKVLIDSQLSEGTEENVVDGTALVYKYPSHLTMGDLGCDDEGVVMGEGDTHCVDLVE
ncbi:hypothetical protein Pyn_37185 [Prunus yedoensis var. nudiflora]|uniref:Uncharacterized protein n=1 Tax=Prunus yedoensis var. nudiflora TaxID=2094558 RepID=A0A314UFV2_PRUYE|nr:hypothetical protein Pyn_37185 [Prunus yedoensis var. nudiflora]